MNTTLTLENITGILQAMDKIKNIDRSHCFNEYFDEVVTRRNGILWLEEQRAKGEAAKGEADVITPGTSK